MVAGGEAAGALLFSRGRKLLVAAAETLVTSRLVASATGPQSYCPCMHAGGEAGGGLPSLGIRKLLQWGGGGGFRDRGEGGFHDRGWVS